MESKLLQAQKHVAESRRNVAEQRARLAKLKGLGRDTFEAERLLAQFETSLEIFEADLHAIQSSVKNADFRLI